jgi:hypothetical protein
MRKSSASTKGKQALRAGSVVTKQGANRVTNALQNFETTQQLRKRVIQNLNKLGLLYPSNKPNDVYPYFESFDDILENKKKGTPVVNNISNNIGRRIFTGKHLDNTNIHPSTMRLLMGDNYYLGVNVPKIYEKFLKIKLGDLGDLKQDELNDYVRQMMFGKSFERVNESIKRRVAKGEKIFKPNPNKTKSTPPPPKTPTRKPRGRWASWVQQPRSKTGYSNLSSNNTRI